MFSMMDPDHGGTISYKELVRVVFPGIDITSHLFWKSIDNDDTSHARHGTQCGKSYMRTRPKSCKDMFKKAMLTSETAKRLEAKKQSATAAARTRVAPIGGSSPQSGRSSPQSPAGPSAQPEKEMDLTSREVIGALRAQVQQLQAGQEKMLARLEAVATAVDRLTQRSGGSMETLQTIVDAE